MPARAFNLPVTLALSAAVVGLATATTWLLVRAMHRRLRRDLRARIAALEAALVEHVARGARPSALRRRARGVPPEPFWWAIERFGHAASPLDRRRVGHVLDRNPHVRAERRALRDESPWRRELAARRLGLVACPGSVRPLRHAMVRGPELVSAAAAIALGRGRDPAALVWLLAHPARLARRTHRTRVDVLLSFGPGAAPLLAARLEDDDAAGRAGTAAAALEAAALDVLALHDFRAAAGAIARRLVHPEPEVRTAAARALGRIGGTGHAPALAAALGDDVWPVRALAARSLGTLGAREAIPALAACLTDRGWWVRRHAAYALARLGAPGRAALEHVRAASPDRYAREMAAEALDGGWPPREARSA